MREGVRMRLGRMLGLSVCVLLWSSTSQAQPTVPQQTTWKRLDTPNFEVLGNTGDGPLREVAERLEQFRGAMGLLFPNVKEDAASRPRVFVFRNHKTYNPYKPLYNGKPAALGGYFLRGPDLNHITLTVENLDDNVEVIYHEYVHLMMADAIGAVPAWISEGLAEYYSTFATAPGGKQVQLGLPHPTHIVQLREQWMPLATLVQVDRDSPQYNERDKQSLFYAQSWALVHYLLLGNQQRYSAQAAPFVAALAAGESLEQACRSALHIEPRQLESELRRYIENGRFQYQSASFTDRLERLARLPVVPVPEAEAHAALGNLLWRIDRGEDAEAHLARALTADEGLVSAHAALGQFRLRQGKPGEAIGHLERASGSSGASYLTHYQYAAALAQAAAAGGAPADANTRQEVALRRAIALNPRFADAYHLLAIVLGRTREGVAEGLQLVQRASELAPGREAFLLTTAYLHANQQNVAAARALTRALESRATDADLRKRARELDQQLARFADQQKAAATTAAPGGGPPPAGTAEGSPVTTPVLREVQTGELRVTGHLVAIECRADGARLHVDDKGTVLVFRATRFDAVEFITYRKDLTGAVGCGKRAALDPVVVTYKPDASPTPGSAGAVVAVEFVPK